MDRILCKGGTLLSCIPEFWLSLVLILVFAVTLHLLPSSGAYDIGYKDDVLNRIEQLILPLVIVVLQHLWYHAYMIRNKLATNQSGAFFLMQNALRLSAIYIKPMQQMTISAVRVTSVSIVMP